VRLKVLTPVEVVLDRGVTTVVAEGANGSFGLKPRHADFVSSLVPGLLHFREREGGEGEYVAVDRGLLVKRGEEVLVSVRSAVRGVGLEELVRAVEERFSVLDDHERSVRSAVARLESDFVRRFMELK
jgi:F-type H+-transporting ATPase subunit epsilon